MLIRSKKIRINLFHAAVLGIFFIIAFSPLLIHNYTTHGVLIDASGNYELINKSKYQTPDWVEKLKIEAMRETPTNFFIDLDLFYKNYFYNIFLIFFANLRSSMSPATIISCEIFFESKIKEMLIVKNR